MWVGTEAAAGEVRWGHSCAGWPRLLAWYSGGRGEGMVANSSPAWAGAVIVVRVFTYPHKGLDLVLSTV